MKEIFRKIPTPKYGNYGGLGNSGNGFNVEPIDDLDRIFMWHDRAFAKGMHRRNADRLLLRRLCIARTWYRRPVYGRLYRVMAILAMFVISRM